MDPFTDFNPPPPPPPPDPSHVPPTRPNPNPESSEAEIKDSVSARKIQKADREKLRRDRLNDHFVELGNTLGSEFFAFMTCVLVAECIAWLFYEDRGVGPDLGAYLAHLHSPRNVKFDPDRPKNDKATILADTIQLLKDLTSQVDKLKAEYATLSEESLELTQEKNDLREEKASLKSDIENLNIQCQQRLRAPYPWPAMDHSFMMAPPSYPFPMPVPMPPGAIPLHSSIQPYPFFGNQNPAVIHNPCTTFVPCMAPNTLVDQQSAQHVSSLSQPASRSHVSGEQDLKNKPSGECKIEKSEGSNDVTTDLELKTPGSTADQDLSSGQRKSKKSQRKESSVTERSSSSRCSSSHSVQDSSSNSVVDSTKHDDLDKLE